VVLINKLGGHRHLDKKQEWYRILDKETELRVSKEIHSIPSNDKLFGYISRCHFECECLEYYKGIVV